ncbi:DNA methyltransferase [Rhodobacter capsulatus YW2]|nr:DNA methyltransferase [Rhodobacter capsulatus YW2]
MMQNQPLIIDCFAGGGGASTGIEAALGRSPDVAINHSAAALALHAANHPETLHLDSNIWDVDPATVAAGRKVGMVWASPDCKHFSKAKGAAVRDRNIRDLAWVVIRWADLPRAQRPDVILLENVEEFTTWGPVDDDGQPIKEFAGQTFELWVRQLRERGYRVEWRELRACDYGAPTIRKRLFLVARCDGRRIVWPAPTHGDPKSPAVRKGRLKPWRAAAECIDWSLPCPSIFDTAQEIMAKHGLRAIRPLAENTLARIARGMARYVIGQDRPFVVNLTAPIVTYAQQGGGNRPATAPMHTICASRKDQNAVIVPSLTRFNGGATGADLRDPMPTVTANSWIKKPGGAAPLGILAPYLASIAHGDSGGRREYPLADPIGTVTVGGIQHALIAPTLVQTGYGERTGQAPRALDIGQPLGTVVAGGVKHAVGAAFLAQHHTGVTGHDAREPMSTISQTGSHQMPVAAFLAKYYGTGDGSTYADPMHTVTVKDRMAHVEASLAAPPFGPEHHARARQVAEFLRAHGAWDGGEFVTLIIDGAKFVVVDIGMRMLTPRELFRAQGFPDDYVIEGVWERLDTDAPTWRAFPGNVQVSCCGNSVCPPMAEALVRANCAHLSAEQWGAVPEQQEATHG